VLSSARLGLLILRTAMLHLHIDQWFFIGAQDTHFIQVQLAAGILSIGDGVMSIATFDTTGSKMYRAF
jgi:hypothetical protein